MAVTACGPDEVGSETETGETGASETTTAAETEDTGEPEDEDLCGNGVIDPGEACEPTDGWCDTCTWDCQDDPLPANEWTLALEGFERDGYDTGSEDSESWRILAMGPSPLLAVRGVTVEGEARIVRVSPEGELLSDHGPAEHGFDTILAHAISEDGELAILGRVGEGALVRRQLVDGTYEPALELSDDAALPERVAITSAGFALLSVEGEAYGIGFDGAPLWTRPGPYGSLYNMADRLMLQGDEFVVEFFAGDGSDALIWDWPHVWFGEYTQPSSTRAQLNGVYANSSYGELYVQTLDLWTGELVTDLVATGEEGLEVGPGGTPYDATADGRPLFGWSVCVGQPSAMGCGLSESGVGVPEAMGVVETHICDLRQSLTVGAEGGVFVVSRTLEGGLELSRRTSL